MDDQTGDTEDRGWRPEIEELRRREAMAREMGGAEKGAVANVDPR